MSIQTAKKKKEFIQHIRENWFFPVSALAYFCLHAVVRLEYFIGVAAAVIIAAFFAAKQKALLHITLKVHPILRGYAILTTLGICLAGYDLFCAKGIASSQIALIQALPFDKETIIILTGCITAIMALYFVYICLVLLIQRVLRVVRESRVFIDIKIKEWAIYSLIILVVCVFVSFVYSKTQAFYGTDFSFDVIYTSDSPSLFKGCAYLSLTHQENDLRQPLFAIFSSPFSGIPYLLGRPFSVPVQAMLLSYSQIMTLLFAVLITARFLGLNAINRICFVCVFFSTYTGLLFSLMLEQYIIAYFWLAFCILSQIYSNQTDNYILYASGGTMLTSMILLPMKILTSKRHLNLKDMFRDLLNSAVGFIVFIIAFGRMDILFDLPGKIRLLLNYSGNGISISERLYQFTSFVSGVFFAQKAGVVTLNKHYSWQLLSADRLNTIGIILIMLLMISALVNRRNRACVIMSLWSLFSVFLLCIVGWGTSENGLVLYSLYFGWCYLGLLYRLLEMYTAKIKNHLLVSLLPVIVVMIFLAINIPAILNMVSFAIEYYPL